MFSNIAYPIISLGFIVELLYFVWLMKERIWKNFAMFIVLIGLIYDATVVSLGILIGESDTLYILNMGRFAIHSIITPFLLLPGIVLVNFYRKEAQKKQIPVIIILIILILLMVIGILTHLWGIELEPKYFDDILYYTTIDEHKTFPYASIAVVVIFIIYGIDIFIHSSKKSWFILVGSVIIFILNAIPPSKVGIVLGSLGELILLGSIVLTFKIIK